MKTIFVHIGTAKTGSTALQWFLASNAAQLARRRIYYPLGSDVYCWRHWHHPIAWACAGGIHAGAPMGANAAVKPLALVVDALIRDIERNGQCDSVILSSEDFYRLNRGQWRCLLDALKCYSVKLVLYLRRQDQFLPSMYGELVKTGQVAIDLNDYVDRFLQVAQRYRGAGRVDALPGDDRQQDVDMLAMLEYLLYLPRIAMLADLVGAENLCIRPYEQEQFVGNDLFDDFLHALGITAGATDFARSPERLNPSPSLEVLSLLVRTNAMAWGDGDQRRRFNAYVCRALCGQGRHAYTSHLARVIPPLELGRIAQWFHADNARVAREFMGRDDGRLFVSPLPEANTQVRHPPVDMRAQALHLLVKTWRDIDEDLLWRIEGPPRLASCLWHAKMSLKHLLGSIGIKLGGD